MITVGIDEVGRGCWAGPLVAGAVILATPIAGLKDSKKLSAKRRSELAVLIYAHAAAVGIGWVWPHEIDELGLTKSVALAMRRAVEQITSSYDEVIIDGNINYLPDIPGTVAVIKADDTVAVVSAASIAAKVARDRYMIDIAAAEYPLYGFERHVGYGTTLHVAALQQYGSCALHRMSYKPIKALLT